MFEGIAATRPQVAFDQTYFGNDPRLVNTGQPFTVTNVNVSPAIVNQDTFDIPMVSMAGAGAGTDGHQHQWSDAGYQLHPGKECGFITELASADITNHEFFVGYAAIDTSIIASAPTDYIGIRKTTGQTRFQLVARKASGTEQVFDLAMPVVANDTLYTFSVLITPDRTTAGMARVVVRCGVGLQPGGTLSVVFDGVVTTQAPDTVDLSIARAWRAGAAVTTIGLFGMLRQFAEA